MGSMNRKRCDLYAPVEHQSKYRVRRANDCSKFAGGEARGRRTFSSYIHATFHRSRLFEISTVVSKLLSIKLAGPSSNDRAAKASRREYLKKDLGFKLKKEVTKMAENIFSIISCVIINQSKRSL